MPAQEMRVMAALQRAKDEGRQTDLEHQVDIEVHRRALELRAAVIIAALGVVLAIVLAIWGRG
jgi:adenylate kinase